MLWGFSTCSFCYLLDMVSLYFFFVVKELKVFFLSAANWCVCRSDVGDSALQKTLDYACGAGADCNPIHQNGVCYSPNTVRAHCSYAVNSFFQKKGQAQGTCDFASTATVVTTDPSKLPTLHK